MSRFISPITDLKPNGSLRFFKSGTNTELITYQDELESIANPTIVPVLPNGNVQNIFYQGSAKVLFLDEFGQQYAERDPVGGEKELGAFTLWDTTVTYDVNDITLGSDGLFYKSLSNANTANDPTTIPAEWEEIRFIGMWNTNITYAIGEVTQTSNGNLWKAQAATTGSDPSSDNGTNWLPAIDGARVPEIMALNWTVKTTDFTAAGGESYQINASTNTVDITIPALVATDDFTFHNEAASTFKVQILNPSNTINGSNGVVVAGTNIELEPSNSTQLVAKSTTILEIVGVQI